MSQLRSMVIRGFRTFSPLRRGDAEKRQEQREFITRSQSSGADPQVCAVPLDPLLARRIDYFPGTIPLHLLCVSAVNSSRSLSHSYIPYNHLSCCCINFSAHPMDTRSKRTRSRGRSCPSRQKSAEITLAGLG